MSAPKVDVQKTVAYSVDGELFRYETPDEALQALYDDGRLVEGDIYYECDTQEVSLADYLASDCILEFAAESIYDDVGEAAEDAFNATQEGHDELNALIAAWCAKHLAGERYWRCTGREREIMVTAEDVARIGGDA